jgi:KTSC domain-containing protein
MQRVALNSTLLQSAGYQDQLTLPELESRNGAVYHYFDVSPQTFQELLRAESKGAYFNASIRHRFACSGILPAAAPTRHRRVSDHGKGEMNLP